MRLKRITLFSALMIICYFLVISIAKTKLSWYDAPLFPFLSLLVAVFIYFVFDLLKNLKWVNESLTINIIPFVFLFLVSIKPYQAIIDKTYKPKEVRWDKDFYEIGYFLQDALKGKHDVNNCILLNDGYDAHLKFYIHLLQDKKVNISLDRIENLSDGEKVIVCQKSMRDALEDNYLTEKINNFGTITSYKIIKQKP